VEFLCCGTTTDATVGTLPYVTACNAIFSVTGWVDLVRAGSDPGRRWLVSLPVGWLIGEATAVDVAARAV
jgi:hypothetical protein